MPPPTGWRVTMRPLSTPSRRRNWEPLRIQLGHQRGDELSPFQFLTWDSILPLQERPIGCLVRSYSGPGNYGDFEENGQDERAQCIRTNTHDDLHP